MSTEFPDDPREDEPRDDEFAAFEDALGDGAGETPPPDPDDPFAAIVAGLDLQAPTVRDLALVITPIASAEALAGLAVMGNLHCTVVPASTGAVAAMHLDEADPFLAVSGQPPTEALALAKAISIITKVPVMLLATRFVSDGDATGEGEMTAWTIKGEDVTGTVSPGVVLANLDAQIEDLALGEKDLEDFPNAIDTASVSKADALRLLSRGVRRRRGE